MLPLNYLLWYVAVQIYVITRSVSDTTMIKFEIKFKLFIVMNDKISGCRSIKSLLLEFRSFHFL